jgi:hypothetical protein
MAQQSAEGDPAVAPVGQVAGPVGPAAVVAPPAAPVAPVADPIIINVAGALVPQIGIQALGFDILPCLQGPQPTKSDIRFKIWP